jgi:hypothetical protein
MTYRPPTGTQLVGSSDPFVFNDGGRWFVGQNHDYEDRDGNMGMSTEYVADPNGYARASDAYDALDDLIGRKR